MFQWMQDGFKNLVSKIGHPSADKSAAWAWEFCPMLPQECLAMYSSDWLPRKIVDIIPQDATREWRQWQAKTAQVEKLYKAEKALMVRSKVMRAMILDRLFGGAVILIGTGDRNVEEPLDVERVKLGGIKYLRVFSRWELRSGDIVTDLNDEDYGLPQWYEIMRQYDNKKASGLKIHRSRFAFFVSNPLPTDWAAFGLGQSSVNNPIVYGGDIGWGQSVYEPIRKALMNASGAAENTANLIEEAKVDIVQIPNLASYMNNDESMQRLISRFSLARLLKSNNSMLLLGGDEKFDRKQISFAQLPELMHAHLQIASGAADIPIVRLLGQSPAGLNATGDSDIRNYYDKVKTHQTNDLQGCSLRTFDEVFIRHCLGGRPDDVAYEWDSLWQLSQTEMAEIGSKKASAFSLINGMGLFAPEELRPAVADVLVDDGFLPTLDQHLFTEEEASQMLEEQQKQAEEQQKQLAGPDNQGGDNKGGDNQDGEQQQQQDWLEFLDAFENKDLAPRTLYVYRQVLNAKEIISWAKNQGFDTTLLPDDMHVTLCYSKTPVDWFSISSNEWGGLTTLEIPPGGARAIEAFGPNGEAVVLVFKSSSLEYRHTEFKEKGASWDYEDYNPHITITYNAPEDLDLSKVEPYTGKIVLGPEYFEEIEEKGEFAETDEIKATDKFGKYEETKHPRSAAGRWSNKPGMGKKSKRLPWFQQERVHGQLSKEQNLKGSQGQKPSKEQSNKEPGTGKETKDPGTGGKGGKQPQYKASIEIIKNMNKGALPPEQKVYNGKRVETKNNLTKLETRDVAEVGVMKLLQAHGLKDAKQMNVDKPNFPVDLAADHLVIECKGGMVSNNEGSHRWTASIGQPGKEETAALAAMTPEEKNAHNKGKNKDIIDRKLKAMADYEKELGEPVKGMTVTTIINPDTKTFDVYAFEGFHLKVNWRSPEAAKGFVGTFKYE